MLSRSEYHLSVLVDVIVFFMTGQMRILEPFWSLAQYGCIIQFAAKTLHFLKTRLAQARRLETMIS